MAWDGLRCADFVEWIDHLISSHWRCFFYHQKQRFRNAWIVLKGNVPLPNTWMKVGMHATWQCGILSSTLRHQSPKSLLYLLWKPKMFPSKKGGWFINNLCNHWVIHQQPLQPLGDSPIPSAIIGWFQLLLKSDLSFDAMNSKAPKGPRPRTKSMGVQPVSHILWPGDETMDRLIFGDVKWLFYHPIYIPLWLRFLVCVASCTQKLRFWSYEPGGGF